MFVLGVLPCLMLSGRGWGKNEVYVFFFAENFKCSGFKCPCLVAGDTARYAMEFAVLVKDFYCCLGVTVCVY